MNTIPALLPGALIVINAPHAAREYMSELIAELAQRGPVSVLDAGNRFQPYRVARLLRQCGADPYAVARRLSIRRAFTCYQVLAMLEGARALPQPTVVLDLLSSFYDEHISFAESNRLLDACLRDLERLCQLAPAIISLAPPLLPERASLVERVCAQAGHLVVVQDIPAVPYQPGLFAE